MERRQEGGQVQEIMDNLSRKHPNILNNQPGQIYFVPIKWILVTVRFLGENLTFFLKRKGNLIKEMYSSQ